MDPFQGAGRGARLRPWASAWQDALYGPAGFYTAGVGGAGPAAHFRTSVHVGAVFHGALARLLEQVDARLGRPARLDLVDVGAGNGELLTGVLAALPAAVAARVRAVAVEVRPAPAGLDPRVRWLGRAAPGSLVAAHPGGVRGLLMAHEWLDDLPCEVVEVDGSGTPRLVLVDDAGHEHLGPALGDRAGCAGYGVDGAACAAWLARWWPVTLPGARAEVGLPRDAAWAALAGSLAAGTALAVDYGHLRADRAAGRYDAGTLVGYAAGRQVVAVPSAGADLTAHVAVDSCAAAVPGTTLASQRSALAGLGVSGRLPGRELAADPAGYADALDAASQAAELRHPAGLGAFWWLLTHREG